VTGDSTGFESANCFRLVYFVLLIDNCHLSLVTSNQNLSLDLLLFYKDIFILDLDTIRGIVPVGSTSPVNIRLWRTKFMLANFFPTVGKGPLAVLLSGIIFFTHSVNQFKIFLIFSFFIDLVPIREQLTLLKKPA